jgi:broad specificity phosphatase PhoE
VTLRLLFARHGESQWQVFGDEAGPDSELTELGRRQADRLGRWLAQHIPVDYIYASPLKRAHETAKLVAAHLDLPVTLHDNLKEAWFLTGAALFTFLTPVDILNSESTIGKKSSEEYQIFRLQIAQMLQDILAKHADGTILIIAHGGTIETAIRLLLGSDAFTVNMGNTTLHSFTWTGGRWHIEYIDRWEHLREI